MLKKLTQLFKSKSTLICLTLALALAGISHGINMFNYPYFENDEGTYLSQGYAVAYEGKITHYTYWYDHVPFGWFLVAIWLKLTNGPFTFGFSLNSARILMLLVHLVSSTFLFLIIKKLTKKNVLALVGVILFSISPLAVYFHRRLLLDNIMTMWLFASMFTLLESKKKLIRIILASILFTVAVLTKENAIFALPGYLLLIGVVMDKRQRLMSWLVFLTPVAIGVAYYLFFALLKNELFIGDSNHVSLIGTWKYHLSRGSGAPFWSPQSDFYGALKDWSGKDLVFIWTIIISSIWLLIKPKQTQVARAIGVIGGLQWLFLLRGGLVINFYVVPLIAFGAISIALLLQDLLRLKSVGFTVIVIGFTIWLSTLTLDPWLVNETLPQKQATEWIKENLPENSVIAVDHSHLIDLQLARFEGDKSFENAHWFWKLDRDPEIQSKVLKDDWKSIEYIVLTHEFLKQIKENNIPYIDPIYTYSTSIESWGPLSNNTHINLNQKISTNGDWVKIFRRYDYIETLLADSWIQYRSRFITDDGKVIDPQSNKTTSEGQSYALIRSLVSDDPTSFAVILNWTTSHLQNREGDALFSWWWGEDDQGFEGIIDAGWATDADIDIATALILASRKWEIDAYEELALIIVTDIWNKSVYELDGNYYLFAGQWAQYGDYITVNPSYFSPAAYRLFAEIDPDHDWLKLADQTYEQLDQITRLSSVGLIPDWADIEKDTKVVSLSKRTGLSQIYSYDAMRIYWRIAQDYLWFNSPQAKEFLESQSFLLNTWKKDNQIMAGYSLNGRVVNNYQDNSFYGAWLPALKISDEAAYQQVYDYLQNRQRNSAWEPIDNYYTQNWVPLGLALAEGKYKYVKK